MAQDWLLTLLLVIVTMLAYLPAWNGMPIWDDNAHLTRPELRSLDGLARIWTQPGATQQYYPLVHTLFWLEHQLWGDWPAGYHLLNILLHCASALLLVRILQQLEIPGAWLAAVIFALHPIQAESVAWISELKNILSGVFYFGSVLAYLKFDRTRNLACYAAALALFALGLVSKTVTAMLPAAMLVIFWWKRGKLS
jgi:protein O-mannosyl-transferase